MAMVPHGWSLVSIFLSARNDNNNSHKSLHTKHVPTLLTIFN